MKTRREPSFFGEPKHQKRRRRGRKTAQLRLMEQVPVDVWKEIFSHLDKRKLREISSISKFFHQQIQGKVFRNAAWPALDYTKPPLKSTNFLYREPISSSCYPGFFKLDNGDIAMGGHNGELRVLKLRSKDWQLYGKHEKLIDSKFVLPIPVNAVSLLGSDDIASCGRDGVRIWDRETGKQIMQLNFEELNLSHPDELYSLPFGGFVCTSWDGSIYLFRQSNSESAYQYKMSLSHGDARVLHWLRCVSVKGHDIIGEFDSFINRWSCQTGELVQRIEISKLKEIVLNELDKLKKNDKSNLLYPAWKHLDLNENSELKLSFDWRLPGKSVSVCVNETYYFIFNSANWALTPYFSGIDPVHYDVSPEGDLLLTKAMHDGFHVFAGWDGDNHAFKIKRLIMSNADDKLIWLSGRNFVKFTYHNERIQLYDMDSNTETEIDIKLHKHLHFICVIKGLMDNHLLGMARNRQGDFEKFICNSQTGKYSCSIPQSSSIYSDKLYELINGDLFSEGIYISTSEDAVHTKITEPSIYRFSLRNT